MLDANLKTARIGKLPKGNYIDSDLGVAHAAGDRVLDRFDPATELYTAAVAMGTAADSRQAVTAARRAFDRSSKQQ